MYVALGERRNMNEANKYTVKLHSILNFHGVVYV